MAQQETRIAGLRRRAIESLNNPKSQVRAESLLERLALAALEGSDDSIFAHWRLAELRLERDPWNAALHIRKVIAGRPDSHEPQALMGLCQGLLANYGIAIASFRRAISLAPNEAGYHHNLGHFIDCGQEQPAKAVTHLRQAVALSPENPEILASLVGCLGRLGHDDEARKIASRAMTMNPRAAIQQELRSWLEPTAEAGINPLLPETILPPETATNPLLPETILPPEVGTRPLLLEITDRMKAQISGTRLQTATLIAHRLASENLRWSNAAAWAAALDYETGEEVQREVAIRYQVSVGALARRLKQARALLQN